jgi:hypothetical protein
MNPYYHVCGQRILVRDLAGAPKYYQEVAGDPAGGVVPVETCPLCGDNLYATEMSRTPPGAGSWESMTGEQREIYVKNPHLVPAALLPDGDWLILDAGPVGANGEPMGPYILTRDGKVQRVNYHYRYYHGFDVPAGDGPTSESSMTGPAHLVGTWA